MEKNPVKVIRKYCLYCGNGQSNEVRDCEIIKCPLHEWRFGKNPFRHMNLSEEEKAIRGRRLLAVKKNTSHLGTETTQKANIEEVIGGKKG